MLLQDLGQFFGEWDGAFFPIFRQKRILRFGPDVDAPVGEVQVRPVERLELTPAESSREHQGEECPLPIVAFGKKPLEFCIGVGDSWPSQLEPRSEEPWL